MEKPLLYSQLITLASGRLALDDVHSKHLVQVLRMKSGNTVLLTDGNGGLFEAVIVEADKKKCTVEVVNQNFQDRQAKKVTVALSLLKNPGRFEWFLEKATELGVAAIIPLVCERTEKLGAKSDRMKSIMVSALLQSRQVWLPALASPTAFPALVGSRQDEQRFIAHCMHGQKIELLSAASADADSQLILIGPEGDFTYSEIAEAMENQFISVSLGTSRLRTETAGLVAATLLTRGTWGELKSS